MKLLLDMNLPPRWADALRANGFDVVHWAEVGDPTAPDRELMTRARSDGRVVITYDLDFGALLAATNAAGPSVVLLRSPTPLTDATLARIEAVLRQQSSALQAGALVILDASLARIRLLPLRP